MRISFILFLPLFILVSCNDPQPKNLKDKAAAIDSVSAAANPVKTISKLEYNSPVDKTLTPYHGTLKANASWEDKKGKNVLIITERPQYFWQDENPALKKFVEDPDDDTEVAELFAWHYVFNAQENKWKALWTLNDFNFGCCDVEMEYTPWSLRITDLDSNGIAESIFTYASSGGTGPLDNWWDGKLIFHTDTVKCTVKGPLGKADSEKTLYSGFEKMNTIFKTQSEKAWQRSRDIRDSIFRKQMMQITN